MPGFAGKLSNFIHRPAPWLRVRRMAAQPPGLSILSGLSGLSVCQFSPCLALLGPASQGLPSKDKKDKTYFAFNVYR